MATIKVVIQQNVFFSTCDALSGFIEIHRCESLPDFIRGYRMMPRVALIITHTAPQRGREEGLSYSVVGPTM